VLHIPHSNGGRTQLEKSANVIQLIDAQNRHSMTARATHTALAEGTGHTGKQLMVNCEAFKVSSLRTSRPIKKSNLNFVKV
jgi:hypothetical protein